MWSSGKEAACYLAASAVMLAVAIALTSEIGHGANQHELNAHYAKLKDPVDLNLVSDSEHPQKKSCLSKLVSNKRLDRPSSKPVRSSIKKAAKFLFVKAGKK